MEFAHIRALAEKESGFSTDGTGIRIVIGSSPDNPAGGRLFQRLQTETEKKRIPARIIKTGSFGCRDLEPMVIVDAPEHSVVLYLNPDPESTIDFEGDVSAPFVTMPGGSAYLLDGESNRDIPPISTLPLFNLQNRVVLRNCGWIAPDNIGHYILAGNGFAALSRALSKSRQELLQAFEASALEGYIRTGCSTLNRWKECMEADSPNKYMVCNAVARDSAGQGARLLLESDPFGILEGMLIGAYSIGAFHCIVCVRSGSCAISNLRNATKKMEEYNLLGPGILGTSFNAQMEIKEVPEDYCVGNEYLSLECIDRNQSPPHILPAYPSIEELTRNPAVVSNAEALSYLPSLFLDRNEMQTGFGVDAGSASKIISLSGNIARKSTVEIPCGVSMRSVIEAIGGGVAGGKAIKAVQAGIPTGVLLGPDALDSCCHCGASATIDAGAMEILDADTDIVETAKNRMAAVHRQSCGKCLLCFEGSRQMHHVLEDIAGGRGKSGDLDLLKDLCDAMKTGCMCVFGRAATDFMLGSLDLFKKEYEERIQDL